MTIDRKVSKMISYLLLSFIAFPESKDALLGPADKELLKVEASGSLGLYYGGKCHMTNASETLIPKDYSDWCSNVAIDKLDKKYNPWVQYSIKGKQMKVSRFSVRNGCCRHACCCIDDNGVSRDLECCCCTLFSYSLLGSNDNKTWHVIHKVDKDRNFNVCQTKTFELDKKTAPYVFFRFMLDEEWPGCPKCMQVNQIELYGELVSNGYISSDESQEDEESISIIGRIKRDE